MQHQQGKWWNLPPHPVTQSPATQSPTHREQHRAGRAVVSPFQGLAVILDCHPGRRSCLACPGLACHGPLGHPEHGHPGGAGSAVVLDRSEMVGRDDRHPAQAGRLCSAQERSFKISPAAEGGAGAAWWASCDDERSRILHAISASLIEIKPQASFVLHEPRGF